MLAIGDEIPHQLGVHRGLFTLPNDCDRPYDTLIVRDGKARVLLVRNGVGISAEYTGGKRHAFLYQNLDTGWDPITAVDIFNHTLRLSVSLAGKL